MNLMFPTAIKNESRLKEGGKQFRQYGSRKYVIYPSHFIQENTESDGKFPFFIFSVTMGPILIMIIQLVTA